MSDLIDSNADLFMYLIEELGSAHEKFEVLTGPKNTNFHL